MTDELAVSAIEDLCSALTDIIETAPEEMRIELGAAIDAFSDEFLRQPCDVKPLPLVRVLFAAMDKACGGEEPFYFGGPSPRRRPRLRVVDSDPNPMNEQNAT
jgi:hypothetical protein